MANSKFVYDVIIVGGGHAGCEAAFVSSRMGASTLLITLNLDSLAKASCNPSIGGTAKGHLVREIDALGGIMGKMADQTGIHFRMLNGSKGPSVRSPRAQIDKCLYSVQMKKTLEEQENLDLFQAHALELIVENQKVKGIKTSEGIIFYGKTVIVSSGTFLKGVIHIGFDSLQGGRSGENWSNFSSSLSLHGLKMGRLKTGTPARLLERSIDFSKLEEQQPESGVHFSFDNPSTPLRQVSCFIAYTNAKTHKIIQDNLSTSALYGGRIHSIGPRYCPSIEDKVVKFSDKPRHQLFLEPESLSSHEYYINGLSTSMPFEMQQEIIHSIVGLEKAKILRPAYAIEYDYLLSGQIYPTLESKTIENLFFAGQINGTTGYEEAAGQGLIAAINATLRCQEKSPYIPSRETSYLGVMIDDITTRDILEPYRIFTSRAEQRLLLRQDNADLRLRKTGFDLGLISQAQLEELERKKTILQESLSRFSKLFVSYEEKNLTLSKMLSRPEISYETLLHLFQGQVKDFGKEINYLIETEIKYAGYLVRQQKEVERLSHLEKILIPKSFDYTKVSSLSNEAKEKLMRFSPPTLKAASHIHGVCFADISVLCILLQKQKAALHADS